MHFELRNILIYGLHCMQNLFKGRIGRAKTNFYGVIFRVYESLKDPFQRNAVTCNYCGWEGAQYRTFVATTAYRRNAVCPKCLSLERHRDFLVLFEKLRLAIGQKSIKLLDIAPSKAFSDYCIKHPGIDYLSVDLVSQFAMEHMDLQDLKIEDGKFDMVVCYHVLDYLPDDIKGMSEIYRVLKADGLALNQEGIDIASRNTVEWGEALEEKEFRIRHYGQDFRDRWESVGFIPQMVVTEGYPTPVFLSTKSTNENYDRIASLIAKDSSLTKFEFKKSPVEI